MEFKKLGIVTLVALSSMRCLSAEDHHAETKSFTTTPIKENIMMLSGKGGNIGLLTGAQGILLIDDDYKDMTPALIKVLQPFGGVGKLKYIINTHWHGDHTQGNLELGQHATIVAHDNVRARLLNAQEIKLFNMKSEPYPEIALPSVTYKTQMHLHMNNEDVELVHFSNGHTDGDSVVFFKNVNVIHTGDHFFNGFFPFVDVEHGGDVLGMAENITQLITMINDDTVIMPGHGPIGNKTDLIAFRDMLVGTAAEVQKMIDKGATISLAKKKGVSKKWAEWTDGFLTNEVWTGIVYQSLLKNK